jgi:hypothetical protein
MQWAAGDDEAAKGVARHRDNPGRCARAGTSGTRFASFMGIFGGDFKRHRDNPGPWLRIGPTNDTATGW